MPKLNGTRGRADLRGGLLRFFLMKEEEGKSISDVWAELYEKDFALFMRMAVSLEPKRKDTIKLDLPEFEKVSEVVPHVMRAIAGGQVAPEDGAAILTGLQRGAQLEKLDELEQKVNQILEGQHANH